MAKTLAHLTNGLRVKYIVRQKAFSLYRGNYRVMIDGNFANNVFKTKQGAVDCGNSVRLLNTVFYETI